MSCQKKITDLAVYYTSAYLMFGLAVIYLAAREFGFYWLFGQLFYIALYLKIESFVFELLKCFRMFRVMFVACCSLFSIVPLLADLFLEPLFVKPLIVAAGIITSITFYYYCTPQRLSQMGWRVKNAKGELY